MKECRNLNKNIRSVLRCSSYSFLHNFPAGERSWNREGKLQEHSEVSLKLFCQQIHKMEFYRAAFVPWNSNSIPGWNISNQWNALCVSRFYSACPFVWCDFHDACSSPVDSQNYCKYDLVWRRRPPSCIVGMLKFSSAWKCSRTSLCFCGWPLCSYHVESWLCQRFPLSPCSAKQSIWPNENTREAANWA